MRVLIADDNFDEILIIRLILEELRSGITIQEAHNGVEVLEKLGHRHQHPSITVPVIDLVLLDVNMPKMTGLEVLQALQGFDHPRIVVLTSGSDTCRNAEFLRLGADDCYAKPFGLSECELLLREIADWWLPISA